MGYNTSSTNWPSAGPKPEVKDLLDNLFLLLDDSDKDAGNQLAENIFASDGTLIGPKGEITGREAIRKCRDDAWTSVKKRRHTVLRVYSHDVKCLDLLLIGHIEMELANGKQVAGEFTARALCTEEEFSKPKIKLYQVWADSAPMIRALQEK